MAEAEDFEVRVSSGSVRANDEAGFVVPHAWTDAGVVVQGQGTGVHLLHASVAICVLNDTWREARALDVGVDGVAVIARGGFNEGWASVGIRYTVELDSAADDDTRSALLARVDEMAEVPRALRSGMEVTRQ
jgi:hypothetical protein